MKRGAARFLGTCLLAVLVYWMMVLHANLMWKVRIEQRVEQAITEHAKSH